MSENFSHNSTIHTLTKDYVYEKIQEKILTGVIPLGSRMGENVLSKELGVSRTPVREALIRLVHEGFAEQMPKDGVFLKRPSLKDIEEIYDLRTVLECHAALRAAQHALPDHLEQMENALRCLNEFILRNDKYRTVQQQREYLVRHVEMPFHVAIMHAANNSKLAAVAANIKILAKSLACNVHSKETFPNDNICETLERHEKIYHHIKNGNGELAAQTMREHLETGFQTTLHIFELAQRQNRAQNIHLHR